MVSSLHVVGSALVLGRKGRIESNRIESNRMADEVHCKSSEVSTRNGGKVIQLTREQKTSYNPQTRRGGKKDQTIDKRYIYLLDCVIVA